MPTNTKRVVALLASLALVAVISFISGVLFGGHVAESNIKSELVWYNEYLLNQAIEDMWKGDIASAETKIKTVNAELAKMKKMKH
jgi:hypothetical protein